MKIFKVIFGKSFYENIIYADSAFINSNGDLIFEQINNGLICSYRNSDWLRVWRIEEDKESSKTSAECE